MKRHIGILCCIGVWLGVVCGCTPTVPPSELPAENSTTVAIDISATDTSTTASVVDTTITTASVADTTTTTASATSVTVSTALTVMTTSKKTTAQSTAAVTHKTTQSTASKAVATDRTVSVTRTALTTKTVSSAKEEHPTVVSFATRETTETARPTRSSASAFVSAVTETTASAKRTKATRLPEGPYPQATTESTVSTTAATSAAPERTQFTEEDFHTDIQMTLDRTVYPVDGTVQVEITNLTDRQTIFGRLFWVLEKDDSGEWIMHFDTNGAEAIAIKLIGQHSFSLTVDLSDFELEAGKEYKLVQRIGKQWIVADFSTEAE